jgi:hypothetical protein
MTKLPVFLPGIDSMAGMVFPAGLFGRTHYNTLLHMRGLGKEQDRLTQGFGQQSEKSSSNKITNQMHTQL